MGTRESGGGCGSDQDRGCEGAGVKSSTSVSDAGFSAEVGGVEGGGDEGASKDGSGRPVN